MVAKRHRCNMQTNRLLLTPEQFEQKLLEEDKDIERFNSPVDQREESDT
jgi:hypothetical protein